MGYTDSLLADGEVIAMRSKQHPLALILDARTAMVLWFLAALLFVASIVFKFTGNISNLVGLVVLALTLIGLVVFVWHAIRYLNNDYVVTNRRILKVTGVVNKKSMDSSLEKINDLVLEQNLIGRMLDYGDLDIVTASDVAIDRFRMLSHAKTFKKTMLDQKHELEQGDFYRPSPPLMANSAASAPPTMAPPPPPPLAPPAMPDAMANASAEVGDMASDAAGEANAMATDADAAVDDASLDVTQTLARLADLRDRGAISAEEYEAKKTELLGRL
ncbi:MAG: PH domain-containing protein [Candidatus Limnocylindrales bacterium]